MWKIYFYFVKIPKLSTFSLCYYNVVAESQKNLKVDLVEISRLQ